MAALTKDKEKETFAKYIATQIILLVDPNPSSRSALKKILVTLGAKTQNVLTAQSFQEASDFIESKNPGVIFTEFLIGKASGLELLQRQREKLPSSKKKLFLIVTSSTSQSAVAQAAEEDIDAYILKPITPEILINTVITAVLLKVDPTPYLINIEKAKDLIAEGNLDEAEKHLREALTQNEKPSLAHYYLGQIEFMRQIIEESKKSYNSGLKFNKIHYKCMVGLYELLSKQKQHEEAYDVVKRLSQYFPANPKRLSEVLRLAITTSQFDDVEKYYQVFVNLDERNAELIKYICAALVVCAKYYFRTKNNARALDLLNKAAVSSAGMVNILYEASTILLDYRYVKEAQDFLKRFPAEAQNSKEYSIISLRILESVEGPAALVRQGKALISAGIKDIKIYEIVLKSAAALNNKIVVEDLLHSAIKDFPDKKEVFESCAVLVEEPGHT